MGKRYRRFSLFAKGKQSPEISVTGHDNTPLIPGTIEDRHIVGRLKTIATYMSGIMPGLAQTVGEERRKSIINEESQEADRSGSSRSRTASAA
jgi:hypothetical protein